MKPEVVADRLHSVAIHLLRRLRREDRWSGLAAAQLSALSVVVFAGPIRLGELAAAEQVTPATMSRLVDVLERRGLVAREPDAADRRAVRVRATRLGAALLAEGRARRVRVLTGKLRTISPQDLTELDRASRLLEELLREEP